MSSWLAMISSNSVKGTVREFLSDLSQRYPYCFVKYIYVHQHSIFYNLVGSFFQNIRQTLLITVSLSSFWRFYVSCQSQPPLSYIHFLIISWWILCISSEVNFNLQLNKYGHLKQPGMVRRALAISKKKYMSSL